MTSLKHDLCSLVLLVEAFLLLFIFKVQTRHSRADLNSEENYGYSMIPKFRVYNMGPV